MEDSRYFENLKNRRTGEIELTEEQLQARVEEYTRFKPRLRAAAYRLLTEGDIPFGTPVTIADLIDIFEKHGESVSKKIITTVWNDIVLEFKNSKNFISMVRRVRTTGTAKADALIVYPRNYLGRLYDFRINDITMSIEHKLKGTNSWEKIADD